MTVPISSVSYQSDEEEHPGSAYVRLHRLTNRGPASNGQAFRHARPGFSNAHYIINFTFFDVKKSVCFEKILMTISLSKDQGERT